MPGGTTSTRRTAEASNRELDVPEGSALTVETGIDRRPDFSVSVNHLGRPNSRARFALTRDLPEAAASIVTMLGLIALSVSPWLAILSAVAVYVGITLLRPSLGGRPLDSIDLEPTTTQDELPSTIQACLTVPPEFAKRFGLTPAECVILPFLAHRMTDREIADRLFKSPRTVMNQTASILGKLGIDSRRDVAEFLARHAIHVPPIPPQIDR